MKDNHPDVMLYHSYNKEQHRIHLHITPLETPNFSHGLELVQTFTDEADAEAFAVKVQEYLDAWKGHIKETVP